MTVEEWRPIPAFAGYDVSSLGTVRRGEATVPVRATSGNGYPRVWLITADGKGVRRYLHHLVAEAFHGPRPVRQEVRHLNGDQADLRAVNLAWGTHPENMRDVLRHGTHHQANKIQCPESHPYDEVNTYVDRTGARHCRTCRRERARAVRQLATASP